MAWTIRTSGKLPSTQPPFSFRITPTMSSQQSLAPASAIIDHRLPAQRRGWSASAPSRGELSTPSQAVPLPTYATTRRVFTPQNSGREFSGTSGGFNAIAVQLRVAYVQAATTTQGSGIHSSEHRRAAALYALCLPMIPIPLCIYHHSTQIIILPISLSSSS